MITSFELSERIHLLSTDSTQSNNTLRSNINASNIPSPSRHHHKSNSGSLSKINVERMKSPPRPNRSPQKGSGVAIKQADAKPIPVAAPLSLRVLAVQIDKTCLTKQHLLQRLADQAIKDRHLILLKNRLTLRDRLSLINQGISRTHLQLTIDQYMPKQLNASRTDLEEFSTKLHSTERHWVLTKNFYPEIVLDAVYKQLDFDRKGYFDVFDLHSVLVKHTKAYSEASLATRDLDLIMRRLGNSKVTQYEFVSVLSDCAVNMSNRLQQPQKP